MGEGVVAEGLPEDEVGLRAGGNVDFGRLWCLGATACRVVALEGELTHVAVKRLCDGHG